MPALRVYEDRENYGRSDGDVDLLLGMWPRKHFRAEAASMSERQRVFWLLHYGTESMGYYAIFRHKPLVTVQTVKDAKTGLNVFLYEANGFVFNFCETGMEGWLKIDLPLGATAKMTVSVDDILPYAEHHG